MDYLRSLGSAVLIIGLFFFIFSNAVPSSNFKRRSVFCLIFGLLLLGILGIGVLEDLQEMNLNQLPFASWAMPVVVVIYTISFVAYNLVLAKRYHHNFKSYKHRKEKVQMFLYIVYQYDDVYLLKEHEGISMGEFVPFEKSVLFHDEMVQRWIDRQHIDVRQTKRIGTAQVTEKHSKKYYCYLIEVSSLAGLENMVQVSKFDLATLEMDPFHKKLVLRIALQDDFDLKM